MSKAPKVFVSYAWEDGEDGVFRRWVGSLCARLRSDGIDAQLDRWHNENGDITGFMSAGLRDADKVLILCSPGYQAKVHAAESTQTMSGAGWEATLVAASMFVGPHAKMKAAKLVLALVMGDWEDAAPDFLLSRVYVNLRDNFEVNYKVLLRRLLGLSEPVPAVGTPPADLTLAPLAVASGPFQQVNGVQTQTRAEYLSAELKRAIERKSRLASLGDSTAAVDEEIITLKRQLREGGRIPEGDCLGDRYVLRSKLGEGGYATVWRAHDKRTGTDVALKVLHPNLAGNGAGLDRFRRGARIMAGLAHPNIVRVLDHDCEDLGWHYFVMECLGSDLGKQVPASPADAVEKILRVADALILTHAQGHVHRDVKPANILVAADGTPKLADFDLVMAHDTTGGTRSGALGTFIYAAPESLTQPQDVDARADVYGLAMSLLFCLYKKELPIGVVRSPGPVLEEIQAAPSLRRVFERALSWELKERYESVAAFREALLAQKHEIISPPSDREFTPSAEPSAGSSTVPSSDGLELARGVTVGGFVIGDRAVGRLPAHNAAALHTKQDENADTLVVQRVAAAPFDSTPAQQRVTGSRYISLSWMSPLARGLFFIAITLVVFVVAVLATIDVPPSESARLHGELQCEAFFKSVINRCDQLKIEHGQATGTTLSPNSTDVAQAKPEDVGTFPASVMCVALPLHRPSCDNLASLVGALAASNWESGDSQATSNLRDYAAAVGSDTDDLAMILLQAKDLPVCVDSLLVGNGVLMSQACSPEWSFPHAIRRGGKTLWRLANERTTRGVILLLAVSLAGVGIMRFVLKRRLSHL